MLIKSLPSDVEDYILKYLIMPLDIETLNRVSKNVKKLVNNTKFVIEKNKITDKILMLIEDDFFFKYRADVNNLHMSSLADCWNKYHKWSWENPTKKKIVDEYWTIGDFVDAEDKIHVWGPAYISDIKLEPTGEDFIETRRLYKVEFLGWSREFDEWISIEKIKKLGTKILNPINSYESLDKDNEHWVLFNNNNKWNICICKKISNKNNSITINLRKLYYRDDNTQIDITEDNISLYLKPCTNISTFLCSDEKNLKIYNRKILM